MADARLRALERTWRASGDLADGVAWLRERIRAGDLALERVELAASLGSALALAVAAPAPAPGSAPGWAWPAYRALQSAALPGSLAILVAADLVERAARRVAPGNPALLRALEVARAWAQGHVTGVELEAARAAATRSRSKPTGAPVSAAVGEGRAFVKAATTDLLGAALELERGGVNGKTLAKGPRRAPRTPCGPPSTAARRVPPTRPRPPGRTATSRGACSSRPGRTGARRPDRSRVTPVPACVSGPPEPTARSSSTRPPCEPEGLVAFP